MDIQPGQECARCTCCLDDSPYTVIHTEKGAVKEVICNICNLVEYMDDYKKNGIITTKIMMEGSLAKYYFEEGDLVRLRAEFREFYMQNKIPLLKVADDVTEISKLVNKFEEKHWLPYLKKYWNDASKRGHIADSKNCTIMMWGSAGRVLITAEQPGSDITMIFSDYVATDESIKRYGNMTQRGGGIQGIRATKDAAIFIMNELIKMKNINFHPKESVKMAGL